MGVDVVREINNNNRIDTSECIQCGACVDNCPRNVLVYGLAERKETGNGK